MANTILDIHAPVESSASQGRVPPQAVDVEKAVLGAMLIDKEAAPKALELLDPTSFYNPTNQKLFQSMVSLFEKGEAIDAVTGRLGRSARHRRQMRRSRIIGNH